MKALALVDYGSKGRIKTIRELIPTNSPQYAIYPIGTTFDKDMLKEYRTKVIEIEILADAAIPKEGEMIQQAATHSIVQCDEKCGATEHPKSIEEYEKTLEHYKSHCYCGGCSHGR